METVYIAAPSYDGKRDDKNAQRLYLDATQKYNRVVVPYTGSLLALAFNGAWCYALNNYGADGAKWFAMLHADILPDPFWLDTLIEEAERVDADMMSAVVPIKDTRGMTSTAIAHPTDPWQIFCRLTLKQIWNESFPETFNRYTATAALQGLLPQFTVPDTALLVNTGCFVCRIDRIANENPPFFTIRDRLVQVDGQWTQQVQPEDWYFSRFLDVRGHSVYATRKLGLVHWGNVAYPSTGKFGEAFDTDWLKEPKNA